MGDRKISIPLGTPYFPVPYFPVFYDSGIPVLVTSMNRRNFDPKGKVYSTLGDYPDAVRQAGPIRELSGTGQSTD